MFSLELKLEMVSFILECIDSLTAQFHCSDWAMIFAVGLDVTDPKLTLTLIAVGQNLTCTFRVLLTLY